MLLRLCVLTEGFAGTLLGEETLLSLLSAHDVLICLSELQHMGHFRKGVVRTNPHRLFPDCVFTLHEGHSRALAAENNMADSRARFFFLRRSAKAPIPPELGFIIGRSSNAAKKRDKANFFHLVGPDAVSERLDGPQEAKLAQRKFKVRSFWTESRTGLIRGEWIRMFVIFVISIISEICRRKVRGPERVRETR